MRFMACMRVLLRELGWRVSRADMGDGISNRKVAGKSLFSKILGWQWPFDFYSQFTGQPHLSTCLLFDLWMYLERLVGHLPEI